MPCHCHISKMTGDSHYGAGIHLNRLNILALSSLKPVITNGRLVCEANFAVYHHDLASVLYASS